MNSHCWIATKQSEFLWFNNTKDDWILHPPDLQTQITAAYRQSRCYIENNIVFIPTKQRQVSISEKDDVKEIESNQSCEKVIEMLTGHPQNRLQRRIDFDDCNTMIHDMGGKIKSQYQNGPFDKLSALSLIKKCAQEKIFKKKDGHNNEFCIFNKID